MYFEWVIRVFRLPENGGCNKKDKRKCPRQPENANLPFCAVLGARMAERWQVGTGEGRGVFRLPRCVAMGRGVDCCGLFVWRIFPMRFLKRPLCPIRQPETFYNHAFSGCPISPINKETPCRTPTSAKSRSPPKPRFTKSPKPTAPPKTPPCCALPI